MTAPFKTWTVLPHGKLTEIDDGLLTVVGELKMPLVEIPRRMTVAKLRGGGLVIFSAVSLDQDAMAELEAFGPPSFLIVPNGHHRLDAGAWKARYPDIQVIAPPGAREQVDKAVPVDATTAAFDDPAVRLIEVGGTRELEFALEVERDDGTTLVINDMVANIHGETGLSGWLLELMKFAGDEPVVPGPVKMTLKDRDALKAQFLAWADLPGLKRILVSHGDIIDADPAGTLRELAASLD